MKYSKNNVLIDKNLAKRSVINEFYMPLSAVYDFFSPLMIELFEKTKNKPIKKRHLSHAELQELKNNEFANVALYEIDTYDEVAGSNRFDRLIKAEFYQLWCNPTENFILFLNKNKHLINAYNKAKYEFYN